MSGKLPNGQGSIRKRADGLWEGRITLLDGRRVSFYDQKRDVVVRQLRAAAADRDKGLPVGPEKMTLEQFLTKWLEVKEATLRSPRTWERYAELTRLHIIPTLGSINLTKLTARQVQDLYANKRAEGLSSTTVHHIHAVLHAALEYAVRQEYVYRNVSEAVDAPKLHRRKMTAWTAQQARQFLSCAQTDRLYGLFVLALATGMRQGELFGLRWQDVNLETGVINVVYAIRRSRQTGTELAKPKTDSSQRTIAIDGNTVAVLKAHRVKQDEERLLAGDAWTDNDLVFADSTGGPLRGNNVERRHFGPLMAGAGIPRIRFHDLRHTAASIMVANGVPIKVVSEMLGHASISLTLTTYVHVSPSMQRDAANVLGSALFS